MVKNEADIIEAFCRYNARFFDLIILIDNGSVDRTKEIIVELSREGLPLVIAEDPEFAYRQSERMTRAFRHVCDAVRPDFVMFLDADEFVLCRDRGSLLATLEQLPGRSVGLVPWRSYVCPPRDPRCVNPLRYMTRRLRDETATYHKTIVAVPKIDFANLEVTQGNHRVVLPGGEIPCLNLTGIHIGHFPLRSPQQLTTKIIVGRMAYVARSPSNENAGFQWHRLYHRLIKTGQLTWQQTSLASIGYLGDRPSFDYNIDTVVEPVPVDFALRYTSESSDPVPVIARSWEMQLLGSKRNSRLPQQIRARLEALEQLPEEEWSTDSWPLAASDLPPLSFLFQKYRPVSVLDIGCGFGARLLQAKEHGIEVVRGVDDIPPRFSLLAREEYHRASPKRPIDLKRTFDLVICVSACRTAARLGKDRLAATVDAHARDLILFSAGDADDRQSDASSLAYWLDEWGTHGWSPLVNASLGLRAIATVPSLKRQMVLLSRSGDDSARAADVLLRSRHVACVSSRDRLPPVIETVFAHQISAGESGPAPLAPPGAPAATRASKVGP